MPFSDSITNVQIEKLPIPDDAMFIVLDNLNIFEIGRMSVVNNFYHNLVWNNFIPNRLKITENVKEESKKIYEIVKSNNIFPIRIEALQKEQQLKRGNFLTVWYETIEALIDFKEQTEKMAPTPEELAKLNVGFFEFESPIKDPINKESKFNPFSLPPILPIQQQKSSLYWNTPKMPPEALKENDPEKLDKMFGDWISKADLCLDSSLDLGLDLEGLGLKYLPDSLEILFTKMPALGFKNLNLSHNQFIEIPASIIEIDKFPISICLDHNHITQTQKSE